jgi:sigma-B regulation protein RsbU (phosphoserine phosphatase)
MPFHSPAEAGSVGGVHFCWRLQPARGETTSGDALFRETGRPDGGTLFLVVDVTHHGPAAAEVVRLLHERFLADRACAGRSPADLLQTLHGMLQPVWAQTGKFVAALVLWVGPNGSLQGAAAGVPPPQGRSAGQPWAVRALAGGPLLGVPLEGRYGQSDLPLGSGAMLLACTDGVTEARDPSGLMYGHGRLAEFLARLAEAEGPALLAGLLADLRDHVGPAWPQDDTTLLCLWSSPGERGRRVAVAGKTPACENPGAPVLLQTEGPPGKGEG